jgi:hypothetical protein
VQSLFHSGTQKNCRHINNRVDATMFLVCQGDNGIKKSAKALLEETKVVSGPFTLANVGSDCVPGCTV